MVTKQSFRGRFSFLQSPAKLALVSMRMGQVTPFRHRVCGDVTDRKQCSAVPRELKCSIARFPAPLPIIPGAAPIKCGDGRAKCIEGKSPSGEIACAGATLLDRAAPAQ